MIVILQYLRHELSVPMTVLVYYEVGTQWDNIRTSRKRKVRVIRYYMPENMPDSWGCQLPILCVHVIMCPVLTVRVLPLSLSLPLLSEGFPLAVPLRVWSITMKKPAHFSTNWFSFLSEGRKLPWLAHSCSPHNDKHQSGFYYCVFWFNVIVFVMCLCVWLCVVCALISVQFWAFHWSM